MTPQELQKRLSFVDNPALEALWYFQEQNPPAVDDFIARRKAGEPYAKIMGHKGFWRGDFRVSRDVLDPRPETELIIENVCALFPDKTAPLRFLDIGTGSGCILASLLYEYPNAVGTGIDICDKALMIAKQNASKAQFYRRDFYDPCWTKDLGTFNVITANPPYIKTADIAKLDVSVTGYDPLLALDGGPDGLSAYRALASTLKPLCQNSLIFFEIGQGQEQAVQTIMAPFFTYIKAVPDYNNIIRIMIFQG